MEAILDFLKQTGFFLFTTGDGVKQLAMIAISFVLMYLAIKFDIQDFRILFAWKCTFNPLCNIVGFIPTLF